MVGALAAAGCEVVLVTLPGQGSASLPAGASHRALPVFATNYLERALRFERRVARELHSIAPDVVHFRGIFEGQAAVAYARDRGVTTIFEVNGLPSVELAYHYPAVGERPAFREFLRQREDDLLRVVDAVLTQSEATADFLRSRGLPPTTPLFVVANGANPEHFASRAAGSTALPTVLYAGTLSPWQGIAELLMASRRCARFRPLRVVLAGPVRRRWRRQLERVIRRLDLAETVELTGALSREALAERIAGADVCVAPLRRDVRNAAQGCSPIKLFEYMAAGRPTIVTDLPCTREIVGPERGVLLHRSHPRALARAILELLDDRERSARLGEQARAWLTTHATWEIRGAALRSAYATLGLAARG
jgi:glycosyltransferase involved in cell wall biosynthesis